MKQSLNSIEHLQTGISEQISYRVPNQSIVLQAKDIRKHFDHNGKSSSCTEMGENLNIKKGDFICIVGPSGCGKSTFLNIVAGLEKPDSGEILLNGKPISDSDPNRIMVFQEGALFPWLKVIDNVEFGLKMKGFSKEQRSEISQRYLDMMERLQNLQIHILINSQLE